MKYEYGFIGCGNMGGAIADAVAKTVNGTRIAVSDHSKAKAERLSDAYGITCTSNEDIAENSRFIVLGVKPQMLGELLSGISHILLRRANAGERFVMVSMAAGMSTEQIAKLAGGEYPVIRIMPNTPVSVGEGTVLYCANSAVTNAELEAFVAAMKCAGVLDALPEKLIDAGSAVSGCGPAFVALMIEALADGGVECGLPRDKALLYAAQTFAGTAKLLIESGKHPGKLKDEVCSPGGTTIKGMHALEAHGTRGAIYDAVVAAYEKSLEFAKK